MELDGNKAIVIIWQGCLCLVRVVSLKWDRHAKKQKNVSPSTLNGKMRKAPKNSKELVLAVFCISALGTPTVVLLGTSSWRNLPSSNPHSHFLDQERDVVLKRGPAMVRLSVF